MSEPEFEKLREKNSEISIDQLGYVQVPMTTSHTTEEAPIQGATVNAKSLQQQASIMDSEDFSLEITKDEESGTTGKRTKKRFEFISSYKSIAEGLMDIALLSANANQLRFLITYNHEASTYYISLGLVILSLTLQVAVGIALIFKRRMQRFSRSNDFIVGGVFMVTVVNILLAAFTTTDNHA